MDYSRMSSPTAGLGIDVDLSALDPVPTGSVAQNAARRRQFAPQNGWAWGEPLVDAGRDLHCVGSYHRAGWPGTTASTWLRLGVVERLIEAQTELPDRFGFAVFDGWRSPETVRALYAHYYGPGSTLEPGYLADPDADRGAPPPHETGAAVDLTLTWDGMPLSLGTPFDEFTPRAHLAALEVPGAAATDRLDRDLRRLLYAVLTEAGFAAYDQEWWHYSYGDAAWADRHGATALYGATTPNR